MGGGAPAPAPLGALYADPWVGRTKTRCRAHQHNALIMHAMQLSVHACDQSALECACCPSLATCTAGHSSASIQRPWHGRAVPAPVHLWVV